MELALFENYEQFITEHSDDLATPSGALKMITDNGMYRAYVDSLTEGLEPRSRNAVLGVVNRQREMYLTEAANVPGTTLSLGWTVLSFPILVDIYAEPIISELCNVYPVSSPIASIPRIKIMAYIKGYSGTTTQVRIPTMTQSIRPSALNLSVTPATSNNMFTIATAAVSPASVTADLYRINKRYTIITSITTRETLVSTSTVDNTTAVIIRPDNRNQFIGTFTFTDNAGLTTVGSVTGHINYDTGVFTFNVLYSGGTSTSTFACTGGIVSMRFMPTNTMNGRVRVKIETEMTDVTIDPNEDFLIELPPEDIQDFQSIFKIDIIRTLSEAIKRQIMLNKDTDLAYFLAASEADMVANGTSSTLTLGDYDVTGGRFTPENIIDLFKSVVPRIAIVSGTIRRNFNMYPTYLVAGLKTSALLRSLQSLAVAMPGLGQGEGGLGWTGDTAQLLKMKVLESNAIAEGKIYLSTKAPNDSLEKSTIVDLIYQPLYIVTEVTDGNTRNFVKARTLIEIPRTDGLGVVTVSGLDTHI
jgi:hypothetical protein